MSLKSEMRAMTSGKFVPVKGKKIGRYQPELRVVVEQRLGRKEVGLAGHSLTEREALNLASACLDYVKRCKQAREDYRDLMKQSK